MVVTGRTLKGGRGNCRRGGRGPFSTGPERSVGAPAGLGNPADCRRFAAPLLARARTLSSRCAPQPAITYLDDFQIGSGRHFFARCLHHLPPSLSFLSREGHGRGIDVNRARGRGRVIALPVLSLLYHIVCVYRPAVAFFRAVPLNARAALFIPRIPR